MYCYVIRDPFLKKIILFIPVMFILERRMNEPIFCNIFL